MKNDFDVSKHSFTNPHSYDEAADRNLDAQIDQLARIIVDLVIKDLENEKFVAENGDHFKVSEI